MPRLDVGPLNEGHLSRKNKIRWVVAAWVIAALSMAVSTGPGILASFLYFPFGLYDFFQPGRVTSDADRGEIFTVGWIFYIALTTAVVVMRRRTLCLIFYIILCLALALNVVSCHSTVSSLGGSG